MDPSLNLIIRLIIIVAALQFSSFIQSQSLCSDIVLIDGTTLRNARFLGVEAQHAQFLCGSEGFKVPFDLVPDQSRMAFQVRAPYTSPPIAPSALSLGSVIVEGWDPIKARQAQFNNLLLQNAKILSKHSTESIKDYLPASALYAIQIDAKNLGRDWKKVWLGSKSNLDAFFVIESKSKGNFILQMPQAISVNAPSMVTWLGPMLPPGDEVIIKCYHNSDAMNDVFNSIEPSITFPKTELAGRIKTDAQIWKILGAGAEVDLKGSIEGELTGRIFGRDVRLFSDKLLFYTELTIPNDCAVLDQSEHNPACQLFQPFRLSSPILLNEKERGEISFEGIIYRIARKRSISHIDQIKTDGLEELGLTRVTTLAEKNSSVPRASPVNATVSSLHQTWNFVILNLEGESGLKIGDNIIISKRGNRPQSTAVMDVSKNSVVVEFSPMKDYLRQGDAVIIGPAN